MRHVTVRAIAYSFVVALGVVTTPPTAAAPLDPARIPADAKWVIHVDYEALSGSELMETFRDKRPKLANRARRWMQERYGIDPREDLKGLTLFSDTYKSHSGAAILRASYDRAKVESDVLSKPKVKTTKWQDYTLYTWEVRKHGKRRQKEKPRSDGQSTDRNLRADNNRRTVTAALLDSETVVFAPSEDRAKSVVEFLQDEKSSLEGEESRLVASVPDGAIIYGAAIDLQSISRHERPFPILQQHEYAMWAVGERNGEVFEELTLDARNEETARQMETILEGLVALGKVWSADMEQLAELYDDVHIRQEGTTVHLEWHGKPDETVDAVEEFVSRVKKWRAARREQR